ncbi:MAG TPA: double-cubane-cluster-containing anaerobic reductase [Methanospirillum sp.]|uniref:double-cubane-cluster-containing anaerobic reductase n=1 Tax=Methanospirillum sp. TaxID=45200 RepID=UPI002CF86D7D|nr:double-cubane-cluster-containing anaerobic reductase [Methanospirillum sp.]HWQ64907.1 double-cubane-cluster-containing anaerobic reductase [Methanospirillum sp.]
MRAESLAWFDQAMPRASAEIASIKEKKVPVVGFYCVFAPQELVLAAGGFPVALCATKEEPIADGEKDLPRNFCPLIKSSYGFAITDKCPFFVNAEFIIGETTCDGKKKMFELMSTFKPTIVLEVPQGAVGKAQDEYWYSEVQRCKTEIEQRLGVTITTDSLKAAINRMNEQRRLIRDLAELNKADPPVLSGQDMLKVTWARNFTYDPEDFNTHLKAVIQDAKKMQVEGNGAFPKGTPRIIVTGVPTGLGSEKVLKIIEESGAAVVYIENCAGMKQYLHDVDVSDSDLLHAVAKKYLKTPCSCMSPNTERMEILAKVTEEYNADGIVDITWIGCHTYNVESRILSKAMKEKDIPVIQIETDYSPADSEQIRTRIEAFIDMIKN